MADIYLKPIARFKISGSIYKIEPALTGGLSESESTFFGNIIGGFGVKTNALIHPTHNLIIYVILITNKTILR